MALKNPKQINEMKTDWESILNRMVTGLSKNI